jgi:hypothetical protein
MREEELVRELNGVRDSIRVEQELFAYEKYGVRRGSLVSIVNKVYRVSRVDVRFTGKPWVYGVQRKKDGTWGTGERCLYERWTLAE